MRTSKLQAVNELLRVVGDSPVDSLESGLFQAETAEAVLDRVSANVQMGDWDFNREDGLKLIPDANGEIVIAPNVFRIDATSRHIKTVQRGARLYNKTTHSFVFTSPLEVSLAYCFDFEDLPEAARQYILVSAARKFQMELLGSADMEKYTAEFEAKALATLQNFDSDSADYNIFDSDPESAFITNRD